MHCRLFKKGAGHVNIYLFLITEVLSYRLLHYIFFCWYMCYIRFIPPGTSITIKVPEELILYNISSFRNFCHGGTSVTWQADSKRYRSAAGGPSSFFIHIICISHYRLPRFQEIMNCNFNKLGLKKLTGDSIATFWTNKLLKKYNNKTAISL